MLPHKVLSYGESVLSRVEGYFMAPLLEDVPLAFGVLLYFVHVAQSVATDNFAPHALTSQHEGVS
jgi:hypothetical protein